MHYLLGLLAIPAVLWLGRRRANTRLKLATLGLVTAVAMYAITVTSAYVTSAFYVYQADSFDKDGDGVISLSEQSPEQSAAMERAVNDSGRNLTIFLAVPWSVLVTAAVFGVVAVANRATRSTKAAE